MRFFLAVAKLSSLLLSFLEARGEEQDLPRAWRCTDKRRARPHPAQLYNAERQQLNAKAWEEE